MIDSGYYTYLDQPAATPPTRDEKGEILKNIAQSTKEQLMRSKIPIPNFHIMPQKPILKQGYPDRPNKGHPGTSSDVYSAKFQLNMYDKHQKDSEDLPPNIHISVDDIFSKPDENFGPCVSSDLAMSAEITAQFSHIFPKLTELRQTHQSLSPGSSIAYFNKTSNNWIYNLVGKRRCNDKPMYSDLIKCLCRTKSHMWQHHITEIRLPELGCGLDKLDWKHVLLNIVNVFGNTEITLGKLLVKVQNPMRSENMFLAEEYSSDEEMQRRVEGTSQAWNLALEGMLQCFPTNDRNERDTPS